MPEGPTPPPPTSISVRTVPPRATCRVTHIKGSCLLHRTFDPLHTSCAYRLDLVSFFCSPRLFPGPPAAALVTDNRPKFPEQAPAPCDRPIFGPVRRRQSSHPCRDAACCANPRRLRATHLSLTRSHTSHPTRLTARTFARVPVSPASAARVVAPLSPHQLYPRWHCTNLRIILLHLYDLSTLINGRI